MKTDRFTSWLNIAQTVVVIVGLPIAIWGLFYTGIQTKTQVDALNESREVQSAQFLLDINKTLDDPQYDSITTAIEGEDGQPHSSSTPYSKHLAETSPHQI